MTMNERRERQARAVISAIFAFLLFLCMISILAGIDAMGLFSESHLRGSLANSNYIEKSYLELRKTLETEAEEHGLPAELLTGQVERDAFVSQLEDAITTSRETGTSNDSAESSRKELEAKFADRISRYLKQQQVGANQRIEEVASEISAAAAAYYEASVSFPFGEVLSAYRAAFLSWIKIGIPVSVLLAAVLVVLLLRLHERVRTGGCFALSSLLATGIASGIAGFVLQFGIHYDIPEQLPAYQAFAEAFFKSPSIVLWVNGFCLALLSVVGLAILGSPKEKNEVTD